MLLLTLGSNKISEETYQKSIERASNPIYDEKNKEFMERQLEIMNMDTSSPEQKAEQEYKYKELKDEMYQYTEENAKNSNENEDENMSIEELDKKLSDMKLSYEILEELATTEQKRTLYVEIKNKLENMQEELNSIKDNNTNQKTRNDTNDITLKSIENEFKSLRAEIGLED